MSTFTSQATPTALPPPDPSKHVNYTFGMVLGVDDFTQEFAYLSGHEQWLARDLLGYGTVCGLQVHSETGANGPEVVVEPGTALSPRGQLIHVTPAQCAKLNDWLAIGDNRQQVFARLGSPPGTIKLYVVLCYRECPTDDVPIPGEPCRSEDELMAPSRLTDDFKLELRFDPPVQQEEDAVRDFVQWLSQIVISDAGPFTSLDDFLNAIRAAGELTSPPGSPPDFMYGSPPASIRIRSADACDFLRAAFRLWATELRPRWRPDWLATSGCNGSQPSTEPVADEDCLLLVELDVPLVTELTGELKVAASPGIILNEARRPYLVHLRLLQEWLLCGCRNGAVPAGPVLQPLHAFSAPGAADTSRPLVVAAGRFDSVGKVIFSYNGLTATPLQPPSNPMVYMLQFNGFNASSNYIVKGTPLTTGNVATPTAPQTFEVIPPLTTDSGIFVRVMQLAVVNGNVSGTSISTGFMVEITQVPQGG